MAAHFFDWLQLAARWLHVIAAIAWVGASFYFIWVENALVRGGKQRRDDLAGHLWAIHGGGFYYLEKYKGAPPSLPPQLHWFKWEAYVTWLSGVALLAMVYWANAGALLAAPGASSETALAVSVLLVFGGWLVYDALCRTPLLAKPLAFAALSLIALTFLAFILKETLSARAVYVHLGALIGTAMVGNVLFVIIPSQKKMVAAAEKMTAGAEMPPEVLRLGRLAGLRSLHNNYLALPVIFLMIGIHYPSAYNHPHSWLIFALVVLSSGLIRHFFNLHNRGQSRPGWLAAGFAVLAAAAAASLPANSGALRAAAPVSYADIRPLIQQHCAGCHSAAPTDAVFRIAPLGLVMDTEKEVRARAADSYRRLWVDRSMPFNNQTKMSEEERAELAAWLRGAAK